MKIAICDDEAKDAKILLDHCRACNLSYESAVFPTASELLCAFSSDFYDLVFLDIEMVPPNGYEVGAKLAAMNPPATDRFYNYFSAVCCLRIWNCIPLPVQTDYPADVPSDNRRSAALSLPAENHTFLRRNTKIGLCKRYSVF